MKAVVHSKYGFPDVLSFTEMEIPIPKDDEVLVRVYATTVNRTDCAILLGKPFMMRFFTGLFKPGSTVTGTDFAGKVEATGKNVKSFKAGDKVMGFGGLGLKSHAQYLTLPESKLIITIPDNITYDQAAACLEGAIYAFGYPINKLKAGQKVLVNGASGAIGSAAVQVLKYLGVTVTAVCNTKNLELVKSLGAERVIDYTKDDFTKDDQKYNCVLDTVGKSSFSKCKPLLLPDGIYSSSELGAWSQNIYLPLITAITGTKKVIFPIPHNIRRSIFLIKNLVEQGKFKPVIDRKYPLERIAEAYEYVLTGQKTGNVVITLAD